MMCSVRFSKSGEYDTLFTGPQGFIEKNIGVKGPFVNEIEATSTQM